MSRSFRGTTARLLGGAVLAALLLVPGVAARAQDGTPAAGVPCTELFGVEDPNSACVLVIHAAPDAGPVDVYVDGALALPALEFGILGDFVALPAGDHQVQVTTAGGDPADSVIDATLTLEAGVAYEVAAIGVGGEYDALVSPINLAPPAADSARVRVVHASPDAPAVDVAVTDGDVLISNLAYPGLSDELEVPAGAYDLEVRPTGTTDVAIDLAGTTLEADTVYSVYAIGLLEDGSLGAFVVPVSLAAVATPTP